MTNHAMIQQSSNERKAIFQPRKKLRDSQYSLEHSLKKKKKKRQD